VLRKYENRAYVGAGEAPAFATCSGPMSKKIGS
jgi:hypothetical protein